MHERRENFDKKQVIVCKDGFDEVEPNFIYNRCDLMNDCKVQLLKYFPNQLYITLKIKKNIGTLCVWGMKLSYSDVKFLIDYVLKNYAGIDKVEVMRVCADETYPSKYFKNDFHIDLPNKIEDLERRLSKKGRYNIRREKRIVMDDFGTYSFRHIKSNDRQASAITEKFFELKQKNMGSDYRMDAESYLRNWYVTDIYCLSFGGRIAAIIMSCEQCDSVYLENLTYDDVFANYSPGQIAYDLYLKELIKRGKKQIFLLGGNYEYKKRYGSIEKTVAEFSVIRNSVKSYVKIYEKELLIRCFNVIPKSVQAYISHKL
ncbi:GNAT family N-acetyltransferase [Selenomonas sp. ND2010]|uniref:GNAT family N-acetyltransferase n=1 Tax=Selenomonas sp. ND2010 TaxID=1410618 RepID=UPI0018CC2C21|nr:GNAT family N-acetyltransferase [Selenomonas sp. ND2010]